MAEEHKLNTEYTGQTRLREWWPIVRSNFESLLGWFNAHIAGKADRHAATDIDYASGKTVKAKIDEETEARKKADGTISDLISPDGGAKPTNLTDAINREIAKRQDEDNDLSGKIDDEKSDREEADRTHKSAAVLDHPNSSVTTAKIKDKNVTTAKLAEGAVTNEKLSKEAVTTEKITNGAVTYLKIADHAVGASKIMDNTITVDKLNPRTLFELFGGVKVAFSSRTDEESPGDDAYISNVEYISPDFEKILGEPRIEPGSESESFFTYTPEIWVDVDRGDDYDYGYAVIVGLCEEGEAEKTGKLFWKSAESSGDYLLGRLVTTDKIEDGAVTSKKIADGAITSAKIPDNSVTENKIHDRAVTHIKLAEDSVWEANIGSQAVTNDKIANDSVTFNKIQDGAIITTKLYDGAVTNEKIAGDSISHDKLKANSVWENHLGVDAVTAEKIASGAVTNSKLSNGAVTLNKLSSELYTYSKKPVRVGTWVDGTPIWRVAIPLTNLDDVNIIRYKTNYVNMRNLLQKLKIIKNTNMIYLDGMLRLPNDTTKKLLKHYPYVYCPTMASLFTLNANPQRGDIVIFNHSGEFTHTGIVVGVDGDYFTTIEGNTSGGSTIIANGGAVCKKGYYNSNLPGTKFCRPDYSIVKGDDELMSREYDELKAEINALKESQKVYHYWSEIPDWALPTVRKLYDKGIFRGDSDADLNLPEMLMRTMVINDRAGLYD